MAAYININSLGFPFYEGDIRLLHPEIREDQTGDTFPCPPEFALVEEAVVPEHNPDTQYLSLTMPFKIDGVWRYSWKVIDLTQDEITNRQKFLAKIKQMEEGQNAQANPTP
jgi:hypothetical protein